VVLRGARRRGAARRLRQERRPLSADLALRCPRTVTREGEVDAVVVVRGGRITELRPGSAPPPPDLPLHDLPGLVLSPGLVDSHVHVDEPGRTDWEGFATATRAAAAGGVTTLVDMPLNSIPPTVDLAALRAKRAAAQGKLWCDVAFWGGIDGRGTGAVNELADAGVCGFKVFLADSGVPEFGSVGTDGLRGALTAAGARRLPVVVHAEWPSLVRSAPSGRPYAGWLASRPPEAEVEAVRVVAELSGRLGAPAHVLHLSSARALGVLEQARAAGAPLSAETCPHYLSLAAEDVPDGWTPAKCAPPVRGRDNRDELWDGLRAGLVDAVVSDHSPAPPALKSLQEGDFGAAWGGISGLQTQLPVVWTAARARGVTPTELARWQSSAPAALAGLRGKGAIAVGADADLVAWDPDATFVVDPTALHHRHPLSPWAGARLHGVVRTTWLRGRPVDVTGPPAGRLLERAV